MPIAKVNNNCVFLLALLCFAFAPSHLFAQEGLLNGEYVDETCEMICLKDLEGYNLGIGLLSHMLPGDSLMQVRYFYDNYSYDLPCSKKVTLNGADACAHTGLNFLQTAITDVADPIVAFIITQTNYDLNHKLASGKTTIEWLSGEIESGNNSEVRKKYYMKILEFMKHQVGKKKP